MPAGQPRRATDSGRGQVRLAEVVKIFENSERIAILLVVEVL